MTDPVSISKSEKLRSLRADYGRSLPERLGALMHCWESAAMANAWGVAHSDLLHRAHSLAGSAGTFGYGKIGAEAKLLEEILSALSQTEAAPSDAQKAAILGVLQNLWLILESGPDDAAEFKFNANSGDASGANQPINSCVALIEDDPLQAQAMATQLSLLGWDVRVFASASEANAMAQDPAPAH
jgi:HPt (histidine-containing phosphotransfer) domain-containing protein